MTGSEKGENESCKDGNENVGATNETEETTTDALDPKSLAPPIEPNKKTPSSRASAASVKDTGAKLKMPSGQAGKFTRAYHNLLELQDKQDAADVVRDALEKAEKELHILKKQVDLILPADVPQQRYKDEWLAKNVADKERCVLEVRRALDAHDRELQSELASITSSVRREVIQAQEEEAKLLLERDQLRQLQAARRRQREHEAELREQEEQNELERRLQGLRVRKEALHKAMSSRSGSRAGSCRVPPLPRVQQPTSDWLDSARAQAPSPQGASSQLGVGDDEDAINPYCPNEHASPLAPQPTTAPAPFLQMQLLQHLLLAQAKVPVFRGDPIDYMWFRQAFMQQIDRVTSDSEKKLYLLLQQLEGEPLVLVKGCQLDPCRGYQRAMSLLDERYGNRINQALAFSTKLLSWPAIKAPKDLTGFSIHLQLCAEVKESGAGTDLQELDAASTILKLAAKLPARTQASWQMKVVDLETTRGTRVNFSDFVGFVKRLERARNHPIFGKLEVESKEKSNEDTRPKHWPKVLLTTDTTSSGQSVADEQTSEEVTAEATAATTTAPSPGDAFRPPCLFCQRSHATSKCKSNDLAREQKLEALRGLCFACLKPGHSARNCRTRLKCSQCEGLHPTVLHEDTSGPKEKSPAAESAHATATGGVERVMALAIVPVCVLHPGSGASTTVRALLDPASTATFVAERVVTDLGIVADPVSLSLATMTGNQNVNASLVYNLKVSNVESEEDVRVPMAYVVDRLPVQAATLDEAALQRWEHLQGLPLNLNLADAPVEMLIGLNAPKAVHPIEVVEAGDEDPYAIRTALGWVVQGPITQGAGPSAQKSHEASANWISDSALTHKLDRMYYHDFREAYDFSTKGLSQEDRAWLQRVEASTKKPDSHYSIELPFKTDKLKSLQDNFAQARARLQSLARKFLLNEQFRLDYCAFMEKMFKAGHVEVAPEEGKGVVNYIPHHGVYHPKKPGKIRVVYNCASKFRGTALNDCLYSGPDLTNSIVAVLLRFRQFKTAFMADVEAMFYQVKVPEEQRNALRFLWWPNGDITQEPVVYRMKVHLFGATSSPSIANFALRKAATQALEAGLIDADVCQAVHQNFYVDDCLRSAATEEDAIRMAHGLVVACGHGGFRLTKFVSTSRALLSTFPREEWAKGIVEVEFDEDKSDPLGSLQERALGVAWNVSEDSFRFAVKVDIATKATKRSVLARLSQVYDPLGFAAPVIVVARIMFRALTRDREGWDDPLPPSEQEKWHQWIQQLSCLDLVRVLRCYDVELPRERELHTFCDASSEAYSAVVFLRSMHANSESNVAFVLGKARVAPPKVITIPRLELTAAKLAAELSSAAQAALSDLTISRRFFWTDSEIVLKYLNNKSKRFHTFVANRVQSILALSSVDEWGHVPTAQNPADSGSRGIDAAQLPNNPWINGPAFLKRPTSERPKMPYLEAISPEDPEVKREQGFATVESTLDVQFPEFWASKYSSALRFRCAVAVWIRLQHHWRKEHKKNPQGPVTVKELRHAERCIIEWIQRLRWPSAVKELQNHRCAPQEIRRLSPHLEGSIIVTQTRTGETLPIIPPGEFSKLLISEAHENQAHMGRQATMAAVSRRRWLLDLNKQTRRVLADCALCQRCFASPSTLRMATLPSFRTEPATKPFETTGVDYFGPFLVRRGRAVIKAYGVIFTCAASRAVHLETAESLSGPSFLNALRRFIARRGDVRTMISDNGTNLKWARSKIAKLLQEELKQQQDDRGPFNELRKRNIDWKLNPPGASHFGGFWERLIQTTRRCLTALTKHGALTLEALTTVLCECEAVLNNRPLTVCSEDHNDLEPLTPNHLLAGHAGASALPGVYSDVAAALRQQWQTVQRKIDQFWKRWQTEYLMDLRQRTKWLHTARRPIRRGDVVLMVEPSTPRQHWPLGRVTQVHVGYDGEARVATVCNSKGEFMRPMVKLCLLETASQKSAQ